MPTEVFYDIGVKPGLNWAAEIETNVASADCFVVFLSAEATRSRTLPEEARRAVKQQEEAGRPPLAYNFDDLGLELGALPRPSQSISYWHTPEGHR